MESASLRTYTFPRVSGRLRTSQQSVSSGVNAERAKARSEASVFFADARVQSAHVNWAQILQDGVDAAVALLGIAPVSLAISNSAAPYQSMIGARVVAVGEQFLVAIGKVAAIYGAFHEVGHIYVAGKCEGWTTVSAVT